MKSDLHIFFQFIQSIRDFFRQQGFIDVLTPPMVENPGMEPHIHPFAVHRARGVDTKKINKEEGQQYYLHTSPEFHMKELLSKNFENIFTINYCFRDEPLSEIHHFQFLMLEWYRASSHYSQIMQDCQKLIQHCQKSLNLTVTTQFQKMTVQEIFLEYLKIDILEFLSSDSLARLITKKFPEVPLPQETLPWDDYFFLLFLNKIEPHLKNIPYLLLYEYPHHLSALSTIKQSDPRVCERFEIFIHGLEIGNCFNELTNLEEQKKRFHLQRKLKEDKYNYSLPHPSVLFSALERGIPASSGIAVGVERLYMALTGNPGFLLR